MGIPDRGGHSAESQSRQSMVTMKTISTRSGHIIMVDDDDYEKLSKYTWHVSRTNAHNVYAMRHKKVDNKTTKVYIHQEIMGGSANVIIDHIDQNGLNCQKSNLRISNKSQNAQNRRPYGKIKYLGVSEHNNKYRVQIYNNGKRHSKVCDTVSEAALLYNDFALKIYGHNARLNAVKT